MYDLFIFQKKFKPYTIIANQINCVSINFLNLLS